MPETKPRQRRKLPTDKNIASNTGYRMFLKETGRKDITYEMYRNIQESMGEKIINKCFTKSYFIKIPSLGNLYLLKMKPIAHKESFTNWGSSHKNKDVKEYKKNVHTGGYVYKIHMYFYELKNAMYSMYNFYPSRKHKRNLAKLIFANKVR